MRILVICQYYYPEPFRITDLCEELVRTGNEVTVVTGTPNYPMGEVYYGYENGKKAYEIINGVNVHRCKIAPRKTGVLNRIKNYLSYPIASKAYVKTLDDKFDVVFVYQLSPVMMAEAGLWYKKKYGKKLVLYCLDLWPESLCVSGIKRGSLIYKIFKPISKRIYQSVDKLLITSRTFEDYLTKQFKITREKISYLPQYAEKIFLDSSGKRQTDIFHILFAGNIGKAQSIETIIEAAKLLKDEKIVFDIVGDGIEFENMKKQLSDLKNVVFYGRKSPEEMLDFFNSADATLVTLTSDPIISSTLPGKVQTYMAAGKPIVCAADGETMRILKDVQGDFYGPSGNSRVLAENIMKLVNSGTAEEIGKRNREYYQKNFLKEKHINDLLKHFKK